ncbi:hypothetical protein GAGA_4639 [Paraglaciecola agarilytica NO2]|uniref:Uncharacterized protein n=1 Tax=Paraglaciecola agarilytica NO2 TaxID=1125747 RepID=A0ABQ0IDI4_9ALTE|nr:hypothetical protein GAGA_4639 [Paraglaciecola agarilytica NO2]
MSKALMCAFVHLKLPQCWLAPTTAYIDSDMRLPKGPSSA